jgi:hypothetical protein
VVAVVVVAVVVVAVVVVAVVVYTTMHGRVSNWWLPPYVKVLIEIIEIGI